MLYRESHIKQAETEYDCLSNVQALVEANYVDGRPTHHLPSARKVDLEPGASIFFVVDYKDYMKHSNHQIQQITWH